MKGLMPITLKRLPKGSLFHLADKTIRCCYEWPPRTQLTCKSQKNGAKFSPIFMMNNLYLRGFNSSKIMLRRLSIGTRTWLMVSRSRTVTVWSSSVWLSTVTHIGVPMAS